MHACSPIEWCFCPVWVFKTVIQKHQIKFSWPKTAYHYRWNLNSRCLNKMLTLFFFFFLNHKIYKLQQTNKTQHTPQLFSHYFHGFTKGNIFPNHSISFLSKTLKGSAIFRPNLVHTRLCQGAAHL